MKEENAGTIDCDVVMRAPPLVSLPANFTIIFTRANRDFLLPSALKLALEAQEKDGN